MTVVFDALCTEINTYRIEKYVILSRNLADKNLFLLLDLKKTVWYIIG